jgi:hypothetical protein
MSYFISSVIEPRHLPVALHATMYYMRSVFVLIHQCTHKIAHNEGLLTISIRTVPCHTVSMSLYGTNDTSPYVLAIQYIAWGVDQVIIPLSQTAAGRMEILAGRTKICSWSDGNLTPKCVSCSRRWFVSSCDSCCQRFCSPFQSALPFFSSWAGSPFDDSLPFFGIVTCLVGEALWRLLGGRTFFCGYSTVVSCTQSLS